MSRPWYATHDVQNRLNRLPPPLRDAGRVAHARVLKYLSCTFTAALILPLILHDWSKPHVLLILWYLTSFGSATGLLIAAYRMAQGGARQLNDALALHQGETHPQTAQRAAVRIGVLGLILAPVMLALGHPSSALFLLISLNCVLLLDAAEVLLYCLNKEPPRQKEKLKLPKIQWNVRPQFS